MFSKECAKNLRDGRSIVMSQSRNALVAIPAMSQIKINENLVICFKLGSCFFDEDSSLIRLALI